MLNTMILENIVKIVATWGAMILDNIVKIVATWGELC